MHQLFDTMAAAARRGDGKMFLLAGDVLIHYIGDACQPLHCSHLSQGDPDRVVLGPVSGKLKLEAHGARSGYEDDMIGYGFREENLQPLLQQRIAALRRDQNSSRRMLYRASHSEDHVCTAFVYQSAVYKSFKA
jgi:hypothetical protein